MRSRGHRVECGTELVIDIVRENDPESSDPMRVVVCGSYVYLNDNEYCIHMDSPFFAGTHEYHEPLSGDAKKDAETIADTFVAMIKDMRPHALAVIRVPGE